MRKLFTAGVAVSAIMISSLGARAADLPARPMPAPVSAYTPPPYNWTGLYLGGNLGGAWTQTHLHDGLTDASLDSGGLTGFIGGGQVGYNWQTGNFVLGVEAMFDGASLKRTSGHLNTICCGTLQSSFSTPWMTSVAARLGYAWNQYLFYGKLGEGWVDNKVTISNLTTGSSVSSTNSNGGFLWGIGGAWALNQNWSVRLEYDHVSLGSWSPASPLAGDRITANRHFNMFIGAFDYKFQSFPLM